ncbi:hypothetical protein HY772_06555 [Candidatus Woesearchaeota archaeon]|nr:hypothetical protein [Candidatus Woesearchaeota archaeon]
MNTNTKRVQASTEKKSAGRTRLSDVFMKILALSLVVIIAMNFTFLIQRKISTALFWLVIVFCAVMAWYGIPYLKQK